MTENMILNNKYASFSKLRKRTRNKNSFPVFDDIKNIQILDATVWTKNNNDFKNIPTDILFSLKTEQQGKIKSNLEDADVVVYGKDLFDKEFTYKIDDKELIELLVNYIS